MIDETETNDEPQDFAAFEASLKEGTDSKAPLAADETATGQTVEIVIEGETKDDTLDLTEDDELVVDEAEKDPKRRSKPAHVRIAELTAKLRQAERDRDAALTPKEEAADKPPVNFTEAEPDPNDEKYEFGEADPQYLRDLARHEGRKAYAEAKAEAEAEARQQAAAASAAELNDRWNEKAAEGATKYEDFNEVVLETAAAGDWPCPPLVAAAISQSDVGVDVAYHLAKNPDVATEIAKGLETDPLGAAQRFGAIEGQFLDAMPDKPASNHPLDVAVFAGRLKAYAEKLSKGTARTDARTITNAPEPAAARVRGVSGQFEVSADTADFAAFERKVMGKR